MRVGLSLNLFATFPVLPQDYFRTVSELVRYLFRTVSLLVRYCFDNLFSNVFLYAQTSVLVNLIVVICFGVLNIT